MSKDQLALVKHGCKYDKLSAWAQAEIDAEIDTDVVKQETVPLIDATPLTLEALGARLARLEQDNVELWQENSDLRGELANLQDEIQKSS